MSESSNYIINLNPSDIIKWCRERKKSLGYSNQKLADLSNVRIGTIDRIMSGKYTEFKYSTIQPIVSTLLGMGEDTPEPDNKDKNQAQYYYETIEGFKLVVENKNREIEELKKANSMLISEKDFLKKENASKEAHMLFLEGIIQEMKKKL